MEYVWLFIKHLWCMVKIIVDAIVEHIDPAYCWNQPSKDVDDFKPEFMLRLLVYPYGSIVEQNEQNDEAIFVPPFLHAWRRIRVRRPAWRRRNRNQ